ncbi:uncharacterized protein LOC133140819 [Conger conger]|uniref:uncharacterized protein LOC133140819 n=1 Tax=Conger conger TaxID=82655 RepID=UPI002A599EF6|nr:uncharacterized protein LOC133140819 [Conger conger]
MSEQTESHGYSEYLRCPSLHGVIYAPNNAAPFDLGSALRGPRGEGPSSPPKPISMAVSSVAREAFTHCTQYQASFRSTSTPAKPTTHPRWVWVSSPPTPATTCPGVFRPPSPTTTCPGVFRPPSPSTTCPGAFRRAPPIHQREELVRPTRPFYHMTAYQADFTPKMATPTCTRPLERRQEQQHAWALKKTSV